MKPTYTQRGIELVETCYACPEQYDVYTHSGKLVGHVRLRHGRLTVETVKGNRIMSMSAIGDGRLEDSERSYAIDAVIDAIVDSIGGVK